jgi:hypothetical protein
MDVVPENGPERRELAVDLDLGFGVKLSQLPPFAGLVEPRGSLTDLHQRTASSDSGGDLLSGQAPAHALSIGKIKIDKSTP